MDDKTKEFIIKEFGSIEEYEKRVNAINKKARNMQRIEQDMKDNDITISDMLDQDTFGLDSFRLGLLLDSLLTICQLSEMCKNLANWRKGESLSGRFAEIEALAKDLASDCFYSEEFEEMFRYDDKRNYKKQCDAIMKKMRGE